MPSWRWRRRRPPFTAAAAVVTAAALAVVGSGETPLPRPSMAAWRALVLESEPVHESLATANQAMNVWRDGAGDGKELVVALVHRFNNLDRRADDEEYAVAWESDGITMREVKRVKMSCPGVDLVVPTRGPYAYEVRLDASPWSLHPECSCTPASGRPCPNGVQGKSVNGTWVFRSPTDSHFVVLQNEWEELIADAAVLGHLTADLTAVVAVAGPRPLSALADAPEEPDLACPGTYDDLLGSDEVTREHLVARNITLNNTVQGRWCLVRRGGCSETAKVKVCEVSGAVGTIIVDHGNFEDDQTIVVRYNRGVLERAERPVLFLSEAEGEDLFRLVALGETVGISVGPSIGGTAAPGYSPGSGISVHILGDRPSGLPSGALSFKTFPDLFQTAGWVEVSNVRDLLFACIPSAREIRIYDISRPMEDIPYIGRFEVACASRTSHDYRMLDYLGPNGKYTTLLVDPANAGNRLVYYDTQDPAQPRLLLELHADWEAEHDGLGQVRPAGPHGLYHLITWHCSDLYCGKSLGDSLYILNTSDLSQEPLKIPLPMLSKGGMARDVACGFTDGGLCLVSLTWDGLVFVDAGASGSANPFRIIASNVGVAPWSDNYIPISMAYLRMQSGAQKVYASQRYPRHFYVEHADLSARHVRLQDYNRAFMLNEVYFARLQDYDMTYDYGFPGPELPSASPSPSHQDDSCPWLVHSGEVNVLVCGDGSRCNVVHQGWDCCKSRGLRKQCPANMPKMCNSPCDGGGHCCEQDCSARGGYRRCQELECPWLHPTTEVNVMQCRDGTHCNGAVDGWDCCYVHGGRGRCPANLPKMCADRSCAGGDHCCQTTCEAHGGYLVCEIEDLGCTWTTVVGRDDVLQCGDGSFCNMAELGGDCCYSHRGRARCPANKPWMCADRSCGGGDHCCERDCGPKGGHRLCQDGGSFAALPSPVHTVHHQGKHGKGSGMLVVLSLTGALLCTSAVCAGTLYMMSRRSRVPVQGQVLQPTLVVEASGTANDGSNVVVGRPVVDGGDPEAAFTTPGQVAPWTATKGSQSEPSVVRAPSVKGKQ